MLKSSELKSFPSLEHPDPYWSLYVDKYGYTYYTSTNNIQRQGLPLLLCSSCGLLNSKSPCSYCEKAASDKTV